MQEDVFKLLVTCICFLFSFLASWCCDYHYFEEHQYSELMKSPKIILVPGFSLTFLLSKSQNFRCFGVLSVANLPIEKVCIIKNFQKARLRLECYCDAD